MKEVYIGIDEAGKGSVLGSLFISAVMTCNKDTLDRLKDEGVRDSKMLSSDMRSYLRTIVEDECVYRTAELTSSDIDGSRNLNHLTYDAFIDTINDLILHYENENDDESIIRVFVDCPIRDTAKYKNMMERDLIARNEISIVCENKADDKYVIVGAASIIAKTSRDSHVLDMERNYSGYCNIGSGYPSDSNTVTFLEKYYIDNGDFPKEARRKWYTLDRIRGKYV
jgi:ribonuclease HII